MKKFMRDNGILILIIALLLSALAAVGSVLISGTVDPVSSVLRIITTPVRNLSSSVLDSAKDSSDRRNEYDSLKERVAVLEEENAQLRETLRDANAALEENQRLRELLNLSEKRSDFQYASCTITDYNISGWASTITLSRGSNAGIEYRDCVVSQTGAFVGVVTEVGYNWCTVSLITDLTTEIGAITANTQTPGVLEGDFALMQQGKVRLNYLPAGTELNKGDEILTSGRGGVYPSDLVIGTVDEVRIDDSGNTSYAIISPSVDINDLSQVFVITDYEIVN